MKIRLALILAFAAAAGLAGAQYRPITPQPQITPRPVQPVQPSTGTGINVPTVEPAFKPEAVVISSGGPPDQYREEHTHAHAHLCEQQKCTKWCDWRETGEWPGYSRLKSAKAECYGYCMKDC